MKSLFTTKSIFAFTLLFFAFQLKLLAQTCNITGDSIVCADDVESYTASVTGSGPYTYQWSAFGGVASPSGTSAIVSWGSTLTGQVTLVVRDAANNVVCTSSRNVSIRSKPVPVITPSNIVGCGDKRSDQGTANGKQEEECFNICDSTWVTYTTPKHTGSSFVWNVSGAATVIPSTSNSIQVLWTSVGSGTVTVTETNISGCVGTSTICVKIVGRPNAQFTSLNTITGGIIQACLNQTVQFVDQSFPGAGSALTTYQWFFGDGTTASGTYPGLANETHAYTSSGIKDVMLVVENECHCKDTFRMQINVSSTPGPDIFCVSTVCPGATVTYSTNATGCGYNWNVQNGTIQGSSTGSSVTVVWGSTGPGILSLNTTGCLAFCATPTTVYVPIITPNAAISGPAQVCLNQCYKYRISCNIPLDSIVWHLPPNVSIASDTVNVNEISVCFYNGAFTTGNITVDYYHHTPGSTEGLSCGGSSTLTINARPTMMLYGQNRICDKENYSVGASPSATGNIQWTITNQAGNITYVNTLLPATSALTVNNWPHGPGNFLITAVGTSGQYCNSPQTTNLTVSPLPPVVDSIIGPNMICPSQPYNYIALQSSSNLAVLWNVQNGTPVSSAGNSISVLWNATGPYSLSATQVDPVTGCKSDSVVYNVGLMPLTPIKPVGDTMPCANGFNNYSINAAGEDFMWSISPSIAGSVSNGQHSGNVTIQWNNYNGPATITLVRTICGQPVTSTVSVMVGMPPAPSITPISSTCEGAVTTFNTPTIASSYTWNFGDGTPNSSLQNPTHVFNSPGNHLVTLTVVYSANCPASMTVTTNIMVNPKPNVTISTPDPNVFCGPIGTVNMAVAGPVSGINYNWYSLPSNLLASNTTSYSSNTLGWYYSIGTNSFGCVDTSNYIRIDSICDTCSADPAYTLNFNRYRLGCNVDSFVGTFTPGAINPRWNFDDIFSPGNIASGTVASHLFKEPGYYRVRFCVDVPNIYGTGYCEKCVMKVDTIEYAPDFYDSLYCVSGIDSVRVKFINNTKWLTTLPLPNYTWTVTPGGATSTAINPTFGLAPGTYTINLNVAGVCNYSKTITIPGFPNASFTSLDSICVNAGTAFNNTSTGTYTNALWHFGDGASFQSTASPVTRVYAAAGTYTASLTVMNSFGCKDSATKTITVVPNTLSTSVMPASSSLCEGDSVLLTSAAVGGYPAYNYLWNTLQNTQNIYAHYTGSYYVDLTDSRLCFAKSNVVNVMVNPVPRPEIFGKAHLCLGDQEVFSVNYPAGVYTISWILDTVAVSSSSTYNFFANYTTIGNHVLYIKVSSPEGCFGVDSYYFSVHQNPYAIVTSTSTQLCEGTNNTLIGTSPSPGVVNAYWNTGSSNDTIVTAVAGLFTYTVVDSFGCKGSGSIMINELPDFCGMMTGCYEICDTVQQLTWSAPSGYAAYQWYYNGNPISGQNTSVLTVPLYQSGSYTVEITSWGGCKTFSDPVEITFVTCGNCKFAANYRISCGPVNDKGQQTYNVTIVLNNSLGNGAGYSITTAAGTISGLTPATLVSGTNAISFTFTDVPPVNNPACFNIDIYNNNIKCDTSLCIKLPPCGEKCDEKVEVKSMDCAGFDASGNPMYNMCVNVYWGGSSGSTLTVTTASGSFSPNPVTLVNGTQLVCFTYTDLPPMNTVSTFYFNFFDPKTGKNCVDSFKREYKPCQDTCLISIQGLCAFCNKKNDDGTITYKIGVTVYNPFGSANVSVLPVSSGTFGTITPNPIPSGVQQFHIYFTDDLPKDTVICFRVLLTSGGKTCWQDVCVFLPKCDGQYLGEDELNAISNSINVAPNPARNNFSVYYTIPDNYSDLSIELLDVAGKSVSVTPIDNRNGMYQFNNIDLNAGVYFVNVRSQGQLLGFKRLVIVK